MDTVFAKTDWLDSESDNLQQYLNNFYLGFNTRGVNSPDPESSAYIIPQVIKELGPTDSQGSYLFNIS